MERTIQAHRLLTCLLCCAVVTPWQAGGVCGLDSDHLVPALVPALVFLSVVDTNFRRAKNSDSPESSNRPNICSYNVGRHPGEHPLDIPLARQAASHGVKASRKAKTGMQEVLLYSAERCRHLPPSEAKSGGGGRIRTYVGIASRFTVCPR